MPNGIFREQASKIYDELIPDPFLIPENKKKYMKQGFDLAAQYGLTMMHTYAAEIWKYSEDINDYIELNRKGELPVRMTVCLDYFYDKPFVTKAERRPVQSRSVRYFQDFQRRFLRLQIGKAVRAL